MNKTGLVRDVAAVLKRNDVRKDMPAKMTRGTQRSFL